MRGTIEHLLQYNALDCLQNFEVNTILHDLIPKMGQDAQWAEEMEKELPRARNDEPRRPDRQPSAEALCSSTFCTEAERMAFWFQKILPQEFVSPDAAKNVTVWWQSPHQQRRFFGNDLGFQLPTNRKTDRKTFNGEALSASLISIPSSSACSKLSSCSAASASSPTPSSRRSWT